MFTFLALFSLFSLAKAAPRAMPSRKCVGIISSLDDVSNAMQCNIVNINSFTVPAGQTFSLNLSPGTTVNVLGDIQFGVKNWGGPLLEVNGENITFNGNGKKWNGGGPSYWDGKGTNGVTKPRPMMRFDMTGTLADLYAINSPAQALSVITNGGLTVSGVTIDNSEGQYPNANSNGKPAGRNTDGFDIGGDNIVIKDSTVINQDDCIAIKWGNGISIEDNYCKYGHGISLGSVDSNTVLENIVIQGNTVVDSQQAFRIKTDQTATNSKVSTVTFSNNTATNCTEYGVVIDQSYPSKSGSPGNGVVISDVSFTSGATKIEVANDAKTISVRCGSNSCQGNWNWEGLSVSGGTVGPSINSPVSVGEYGS